MILVLRRTKSVGGPWKPTPIQGCPTDPAQRLAFLAALPGVDNGVFEYAAAEVPD